MATPRDPLALAGWRRTVAELYAAVRSEAEPGQAWEEWRAVRDRLFKDHPQSPLARQERTRFDGLPYFPYDPTWRVGGTVEADVERERFSADLGPDGEFHFRRVGRVRFVAAGQEAALCLYWIEGYGGGLFLPFRDATNGDLTYGGGRYLYDTIKGADLGAGVGPDTLILDFNFAYNPSCAYDDRWVCPLPLPENRLAFAVQAGEQWPVSEKRLGGEGKKL
ncbi:MAG: DUF1684 domain-containing protein [Candidatus Promineifilaceae bacterium]|nr:DUF1684 domain-containing protein [Candidatus Promineifilaceae bacterium]